MTYRNTSLRLGLSSRLNLKRRSIIIAIPLLDNLRFMSRVFVYFRRM